MAGLMYAFQVHETFLEGSLVVAISAIEVLFSDYPKCLDLIFIYLPGMRISIGNLRFLKHASIKDK
jgi:hypothetical protein